MNIDSVVIVMLAAFLWFWPQRKRNLLLQTLHEHYRHWPARIGLHHTAWTMFATGTNRNHFLKLHVRSTEPSVSPTEPYVAMIGVNTLELDQLSAFSECSEGSGDSLQSVEIRDPWRCGGIWGELADERLRRVVLAVIRSDTGPHTKRQLARGLVRWCLTHRVRPAFEEFEGTAVYGQELFPMRSAGETTAPVPRELVKYTLKFKRGRDGRLVFGA